MLLPQHRVQPEKGQAATKVPIAIGRGDAGGNVCLLHLVITWLR